MSRYILLFTFFMAVAVCYFQVRHNFKLILQQHLLQPSIYGSEDFVFLRRFLQVFFQRLTMSWQ